MLELSSNTIKVLGIFGRLAPEQEAFLDSIEAEYSEKPNADGAYDIFRHLTLTFVPDATVTDVSKQLDLLRKLDKFLPLKIKVSKYFAKDEESLPGAEHIAAEFELEQTKELVDFVRLNIRDSAVATWYIKLVWFVTKEHQDVVIGKLAGLTELEFTDFYLVSNKQDEANTIYTTSRFSGIN